MIIFVVLLICFFVYAGCFLGFDKRDISRKNRVLCLFNFALCFILLIAFANNAYYISNSYYYFNKNFNEFKKIEVEKNKLNGQNIYKHKNKILSIDLTKIETKDYPEGYYYRAFRWYEPGFGTGHFIKIKHKK